MYAVFTAKGGVRFPSSLLTGPPRLKHYLVGCGGVSSRKETRLSQRGAEGFRRCLLSYLLWTPKTDSLERQAYIGRDPRWTGGVRLRR